MLALLALALPAGAAAADAELPASQSVAPKGYRLSADGAKRIADRASKVRRARAQGRRLAPTGYTKGPGRWQVSYFEGKKEALQVQVDDSSGAILEQWGGFQVAWTMARGYEGQFGRSLNAPWLWIPLCVLFLAPFVDPRRPFRLLHLDLLVLLGFSASHFFFNKGEIGVSAPLVVPVLVYLFVRLAIVGFRGREQTEPLLPLVRRRWLVIGVALLVAFRIGLNVVDSEVIDVGYAGVIGADRIADGESLYGHGFNKEVAKGDTYGPVTYLFYLPFEQAMPWSGSWDGLPAAHGAAIAFDLLTLGGLLLLGRRMRSGEEGRTLSVALAWAWVTYPYALFTMQSNSNDGLVSVFVVAGLLALTLGPRSSAWGRGLSVGLGAAAKFAPLALAPLMAAGTGERRARDLLPYAAALLGSIALLVLLFLPDGGLRELYDRTLGYQAGRPSPFSPWGLEPSLVPLQTFIKSMTVALAVLVFFVPARRTLVQVAALGGAVLVALELAATHWFYLYVAWFAPLALVAFLGRLRPPMTAPHSESGTVTPSVVSRNRVSTLATPAGSSR